MDGIGPEIAGSVRTWAADADNRALVDKLRAAGVRVADPEPEESAGALLEGVTVVITGTLEGFSRDGARAAVEDRGGRVTGSVSGRTSVVVAGASPGAKAAKAADLGVPVLDEAGFRRLLTEGAVALR
jgi:DNA ligase (NAD+)